MTERAATEPAADRPRILFDTNVVLDVLLDREPWVREAAALFEAVADGRIVGLLAGHAVTTAYYVFRAGRGTAEAQAGVGHLLDLFEIAPVGRAELVGALASGFADYEDGVTHEAAWAMRCDGIVTRNGPDFAAASLPVYAPAELLAALA